MRPVCRLCKSAHFSHEPHRFAGEDVVVHKPPPVVVNKQMVVNKPKSVVANKSSRHGKRSDTEKRKTYMREYMRRKRSTGESK